MASEIGEWLEGLGLGNYTETFAENDVDFRALPHLDREDLMELGVSLGHRKVILAAISELRSGDDVTPGPEVAASPAEMREDPSASGGQVAERRQLTVMFCDLVGSTELSGRLDPEDLREVMRRYQDTVAGVVARFEGHLAKFLGDGVLAFFGWPRAYEDQAERAVRSGLAAVAAVADLKTEDDQTLEARVGIATGQVVIGDIVGEAATEEDAITGETPNLAARLQAVASPGQVVIGSTTRLLIGEALDLEDIGTHQLKGFADPVAAWRVIGESTAETRFEAAHPGVLTQFVGREHELGLLRRAWQQSKSGRRASRPDQRRARHRQIPVGGRIERRAQPSRAIPRSRSAARHIIPTARFFPLIVHLERVLRWQREDSADVKLAKLEEDSPRLQPAAGRGDPAVYRAAVVCRCRTIDIRL